MEVFAVFLFAYILVFGVVIGLNILQYVLNGLGLQAIAKRRGIQRSWMAWVPVGDMWLLGCISDQYQFVAKGQHKSKRKLLPALVLAMVVPIVICYAASFLLMFISESEEFAPFFALGMFGMFFLIAGLSVFYSVVMYMSCYDLFVSADPKNAVLYLLLSIFLGSIVMRLLIFLCRNKDEGMPPRKPDPLPDTLIVPQGNEEME